MAKKRRKIKRVARARAAKARMPPTPQSSSQVEHVLGLAGGIIVVIAALIAWVGNQASLLWIVLSLIAGILMVALTWHTVRRPRVSAIFLLVLSIVALIMPPSGFIIGPLLGVIGAIVVLARSKR